MDKPKNPADWRAELFENKGNKKIESAVNAICGFAAFRRRQAKKPAL
jgi:hypothetical protein